MKPQNLEFFVCLMCVPLALLMQGCPGARTSEYLIQNHETYPTQVEKIQKVISIDPDFLWLDEAREIEEIVLEAEELERKYQRLLIDNAAKHGIELKIYAANTLQSRDVDYFNHLLPLKRKVLFANGSHNVQIEDYETLTVPSVKEAGRGTYGEAFEFDPEFELLAEKYGTPYFAMHAVVSYGVPKKQNATNPKQWTYETIFYHVLADVRKSEIIYREIRLDPNPLTLESLQTMIQQSYRLLRKK